MNHPNIIGLAGDGKEIMIHNYLNTFLKLYCIFKAYIKKIFKFSYSNIQLPQYNFSQLD